jgi:hypothetical protein
MRSRCETPAEPFFRRRKSSLTKNFRNFPEALGCFSVVHKDEPDTILHGMRPENPRRFSGGAMPLMNLALGAGGKDPGATVQLAPLPSEEPGTVIGRYKLLERLGEGGFGTVWAAEQREPVRRRVALKVLKLGMDTRQVVARFEAERQALALMDHPHIAKVLDRCPR